MTTAGAHPHPDAAGRQPRRDRPADHAVGPDHGHRHGGRLLGRRCRRAPMCGRPTWPSGCPGVSPSDTYLRSAMILDAAARSGADAIHPGYGFLSESGDFARRGHRGRVHLGGAAAAAIDAMGSKIGSKDLMRAAGRAHPAVASPSRTAACPTTPSSTRWAGPCWSRRRPAAAGGACASVGGPVSLRQAVADARREAEAAFGDGTVFLERYLQDPRHIEVQVLADSVRGHRGPVRTGVQHPAPPPEDRRGGTVPGGHPGAAGPPGGGGRGRGPSRRVRQRRDRRVRGGRQRRPLLPGDEHPVSRWSTR